MKYPVVVLFCSALAATACLSQAAEPAASTQEQVRQSFERSTKKNERCVVSHKIETTAHLSDEQRGQTGGADYYEFRKGGCPSEEKQRAVSERVGR